MNQRPQRLGMLLAGGLLVTALTAPAQPLVVAIEDYPPFEYFENASPTGINIEVTSRIAQRLGLTVEFRAFPFPRTWMLLKRGQVDAALSLSHQPSREAHLLFTQDQRASANGGPLPTNYLWMTEYVFFINRTYAKALHFDSYDQIRTNAYRVGMLREYAYDADFRNAQLNTKEYILPEDGFRALQEGEIDLFPMDRTVGLWTIRRLELNDRITFLPKPLFSKPYLMVFSRASPFPGLEGVMHDFYAELQHMRRSGEYAAISGQYLPRGAAAPQRPIIFVCEDWAPYEYREGNEVKGIDVDVTRTIMERLGIPFEIQFYPWPRAWMLVEKGKADAVLSVSYKASREPFLYFTAEQIAYANTGQRPPDYLWNAEYIFFVKAKHAATNRFESYAQVKADGLRVGINRGYSYDAEFMNAGLHTIEYPDTPSAFVGLVADEIDLYPMDRAVGLAMLDRMGLRESVTHHPKLLFTKPYLAPFSRQSDYPGLEAIMYAYYRELRRLRESGEYRRIFTRYLKHEEPRSPDSENP